MAIITISRQVGALGDEVSAELAKRLGYKFIAREEIEKRIVELGFKENKLPKYDERKPGFFASLAKDRDEYLNYTQYAILEAAQNKNAIIIGRGAFVVLQDVPNNISVRLISDDDTRIKRLIAEHNWDEKQAVQRIKESDANRAGFHSSFYNVDIDDAAFYHAVINTGKLDLNLTVSMIANLVESKVTVRQEEEGNKVIDELLKAQGVVNKLSMECHLNIEFMHASIHGNTIVLHGVSDSPATVEQALQYIRREMPEFEVKSAVSIVHDFKTFQ